LFRTLRLFGLFEEIQQFKVVSE